MDDDFDPDTVELGQAVSAAQFAREIGIHRSRINKWVTRGYIDADGQRVHVKPRGEIRVGRRKYPVYVWGELAAAEQATRGRAPLRGNDMIAAVQLRDRPHLRRRSDAA